MKTLMLFFFGAMICACSSCALQPPEHGELPQSVQSFFDNWIEGQQPIFVKVKGRLNLYIAAEPSTLMILRDLRDPLGFSANFIGDDGADEVLEHLQNVEEQFSRFPYLYVSPLEAFYGQFPAKPLFESESIIVDTLREYENKCVEISGLASVSGVQPSLERMDVAVLVPLEFQQCSKANLELQ